MQVINLNKNGEVIPDLSKVKLPKELNDLVWRIIYRKEDTYEEDRQRLKMASRFVSNRN